MKWITLLLVVMLAVFGMMSGAAAEEIFERDGSKIEGIDLFWLTPDSTVDNEKNAVPEAELTDGGSGNRSHLYLATSSDEALSMTYQFEVSFSGQYDYAPGDIQITIPAQVWHARDKSDESAGKVDPERYIGTLDLSVPQAPSTKSDFNWQRIGNNYVLTNTKTIGATSKAMFQMSLTGLIPHNLVDMSECDPITVHVDVVTNRGNVISRTSDPITAQIDTIARISSARKDSNNELFEEVPASLPAGLLKNLPEGTSPEDYIYVRWYSYVFHSGNQAFSLDIEDTIGDAYKQIKDANGNVTDEEFVTEGILLGFANYEGEASADGSYDLGASVMKGSYHTNTISAYDHTVYAWSAYRKADFYIPTAKEGQIVYVMRNDIDWILTEYDGAVADPGYDKPADEQKVTTAPASAAVYYMPTRWTKPTGHFEVFKYAEKQPNEDWSYGYGLNQLIDKKDISMNFQLKTVGFGYPWTSVRTNPDDPEFVGEEDVKAEDFGNLGWRQITEDFDTFFDNNATPLTERDFETTYMRVAVPEKLRYQKAGYPRYGYYEKDGKIVYGQMAASQYGYFLDNTLPTPDLQIEYQLNGDGVWRHAATAQWGEDGTGAFRFVDVAEGVTTDGMKVIFPENTTDVRHIFVSNVFAGKSAAKCDTAAILWDVYVGIDLKASAENVAIAEKWFELTDTPSTKFRNDVHMFVDGWIKPEADETPGEGVRLHPDSPNAFFDTARATVAGASYGVSLSKKVDFDGRSVANGGDNDVENRCAVLHYTATVYEQSNLINRVDYDMAVAQGVIPAETRGVWYDLLPKGVTPLMDTIRLRAGDTVTAKYTVPDYKGTGRVLLVVEADMTPSPEQTYSGNKPVGFVDKPSITFDAVYSWDAIDDFGQQADNYIAFESLAENLRYDTLGTIAGQKGDPDDPTAGNNTTTPSMPADVARAMTDLDPNTDENRFVYGKAPVRMDLVTMAVSGIAKAVQNDLVGVWTQGLADQEQVTVYEGHNYTYRLRVESSESTVTSDIVIYDTIENYHIPDPENDEYMDATKAEDFADKESKKNWQGDWEGVGQWRGTLESVDLSEFVAQGASPVLYYSLIPDLTFADSTPGMSQEDRLELFSKGAYDLTDSNIWHKAEVDAGGNWTVPADVYGKVTAVALDVRKDAKGEAFILEEGKAMSGYLHMSAPDDNNDPDAWHAKGAYAHKTDDEGNPIKEVDWEKALDPANNMYAFNNTRLKCVQTGTSGSGVGESSNIMIRNDYTRVGILPGIIGVEKVWKDQNNHDNIRPDEVTVTLLRKTVGQAGDYEEVLDGDNQPVSETLNEENGWTANFYQVDLVDEMGNMYIYSFSEGDVPGYTLQVIREDENHYTLNNIHPNEQIEIKGEKQWNDQNDALGLRPDSIIVRLYRDGEYVRRMTVTPTDGVWTYSFGKMDKYAQGGREYVYTVEEEYVPKYVSTGEGYHLLVNDYAPYGDLAVVKTLVDASAKAAENEFTFTIKLMEEKKDGEEAAPLMENYRYEKFQLGDDGESWTVIGEGTVTCSSTFTLKGNEKIVIYDLPSDSTYELEEAEQPGFTLTDKVNDSGIVYAGKTTTAEFTNTYSASGAAQFNAHKSQTGHALRKNQHKFQVVDMTQGSDTYGQVIRTAYSGIPENTQEIPEGEIAGVITGQAVAAFGQLDYTQQDDGKTFTYEITEVDDQRPGYTYDDTKYTVNVTVKDNGDGTMSITALDEHGNDVTLADGSGMTFENTYAAEGEISLKAWKVLEKRDLKDKEFTFELYKYDNAAGETVGDPIATVQNDAQGNVVFPAIKFTQDDVSLDDDQPAKYYYLVKEKVGNDATVVYTDQVFKYEVAVYDNNDGTLSFVEGTQEGTRELLKCTTCDIDKTRVANTSISAQQDNEGKYGAYSYSRGTTGAGSIGDCLRCSNGCEECQYTGYALVDYPSIGVTYYDGALRSGDYTVKAVGYLTLGEVADSYGSSLRCVKDYTFAVYKHDYGPELLQYSMKPYYELKRVFSSEEMADLANTDFSKEKYLSFASNFADGLQFVMDNCPECNGSGYVEGGVSVNGEQTMPVFVNDVKPGVLTVSKSVNTPNPNPDQEFTFKVRFTGELEETLDYVLTTPTPSPSPAPTPAPTTPAPATTPFVQPRSIGNGIALSKYNGEMVFFYVSSSGEQRDPWNNYFRPTGHATLMWTDFAYYCYKEYMHFTETEFINYEKLYQYRSLARKVWVQSPSSPGKMRDMFKDYYNLGTADLSMLKTVGITDFSGVFNGCYNLKTITGLSFETSSATNMNSMFKGCSILTPIDISSFNTSNVLDMGSMFYGCRAFTNLDVSRFDTSKVTNMDSMFTYCESLTSLDLSSFNTSNVTDMDNMFASCRSLKSLDISNFNTRNASTASMFTNCNYLQTISIGDNTVLESYPAASTNRPYNGKWVNVNDPNEELTGAALFTEGGHAGTWTWSQQNYKLDVDPGEGAGSMPTKRLVPGVGYSFTPTIYRFGYKLTGMTDGRTTYNVYGGVVTIPQGNSYVDGQHVILRAIWTPVDPSELASSNVVTFTLRAGDSVAFPEVPAYTGYEIWEEMPAGWVLKHKINDVGEIAPLSTRWVTFTNEYTPNKAQAIIRASKSFDGAAPEKGQFTFLLREAYTGNILQQKSNAAGGAIEFDPIEYTLNDVGKTFTYTISEVIGNDTSIIYDTTVYPVLVTVSDDGVGNLSAKVTYRDPSGANLANPPAFHNTTALGGLRLIKGRNLPGDVNWLDPALLSQNFIFEVTFTDEYGNPWNGNQYGVVEAKRWENDANGVGQYKGVYNYLVKDGVVQVPLNVRTNNVVLYGIPVGTHYSVKEIGTYPGWEQDEDYADSNDTGVIEPLFHRDYPESTGTTVVLMNKYSHKGAAVLEAWKVLEGRTLKEDEFTFQLLDSAGDVIDEAGNAAVTGKVVFDELSYTQAGNYLYTIREVVGDDDTVEYSSEVINVVVIMSDREGKGRLTPNILYSINGRTGNTITNKIKPGALRISKTLVSSNADHAGKEFTFTLYLTDALGQLLSGEYEMSNGKTLAVQNGSATLKLKGGETVTINGLPDGASYNVVEAAEDGFTQKSSGATGKIRVNETVSAAFTNTYHAEGKIAFTAVKTLQGQTLKADQFVFELYDSEGYILESVGNDADGNVTFRALEFTEADVGEKRYTIAERNTGVEGMIYDETRYEISLTIADNGDGTMDVKPVITAGAEETDKISFANILTVPLTISKTVEGCETTEGFPFTVKLFNADGTEATQAFVCTGDVEGTITSGGSISLAHGQSVIISGLQPGMTYTVAEAVSAAFDTTVNGEAGCIAEGTLPEEALELGFVNKFKTTAFTVKKSWQGGGGGAIELTLYANGEKVEPQPAYTREEDVYMYTDLPMYNADDEVIVYSAKEKYVDGFLTIYKNEAPFTEETRAIYDGGTIINKAIVQADFAVKKVWSGLAEGEESPAIELVLYCNGEATEYETPEPDRYGWYKYFDLPGEVDGVKAVYTVKETPVEGYETSYKLADGADADYADNGGTITNAKIPQTGDRAHTALWMAMLGASVTLLALLMKRRKA